MTDLENKNPFVDNFQYLRGYDDILTYFIETILQLDKFLHFINKIYTNNTFTKEMERYNKINFHKPSHTELYPYQNIL